MQLVIIGAAGAGKGTLAEKIKRSYNLAHISTGDMFRSEMASGSELGLLAKKYIDEGHLVPDEVTIKMVSKRLQNDDCKEGFLLDGFPRTLNQAVTLDSELSKTNQDLQLVINLSIDSQSLKKRITGRRVCPTCQSIYHIDYSPSQVAGICDSCGSKLIQRSDDTEERLNVRLEDFYNLTSPVLAHYREKRLVVDLDATQLPESVWDEVYPFLRDLK